MKRDRILFLIGYFPFGKGGSEYQAMLIAEKLRKLMDVSFLYIDSEKRPKKMEKDGYTFYSINNRPLLIRIFNKYFVFDYFRLIRLITEINPDFIYQRVGFAYTGIAANYTRKNSCKMIWHIASENDVTPFKFEWNRAVLFNYIDKKVLEYGIRNTDYIIGQAKYQDKLLRENYGKKCDLIVPNFHPRPKHEIRKKYPIKVVWIANFKKFKQPEVFIKLLQEFKDYKNVKFIMIGRPAEKKNWQSKLESIMNGLDNLVYLGEKPIDEVNRILCESHIFVNTSKYEGFPNTFVQAWMRKVPVVSLNVDPDNILKNEKIGFHSGNYANMVKDLNNLIINESLREGMGEKAQKYAFKNHTVDKNIKKIVRLFSSSH